VRANAADIRPRGDSVVLYIQGKGQQAKSDYVKLTPHVDEAVSAYLSARGGAGGLDPLFTSLSNNSRLKRLSTRSVSAIVKHRLIAAALDSPRLTAHSLRHTAGTLNILGGGTLEETQQLLRHRDISTTMIYLHHLERDRNQSEARIADAIFG